MAYYQILVLIAMAARGHHGQTFLGFDGCVD